MLSFRALFLCRDKEGIFFSTSISDLVQITQLGDTGLALGIQLDQAVQPRSGSGQEKCYGQWEKHTSEKRAFFFLFSFFLSFLQVVSGVVVFFQPLIKNVDTRAVGLSSLKNAECCNVNIPLSGPVCFGIMEYRGQPTAGHFFVVRSAN